MPTNTTERPILAMFLSPGGGCEIIYDDPKPSPPSRPARRDELRLAAQHLWEALAALRRATRTG
jgi:hypothetical protein